MRPFFSYYGAKYTVAKYAGPPSHDLVIEPFAGSAAYSTRYNVTVAALYDVNPDICDLWDWLIHCSDADVHAIPDYFDDFQAVEKLSRGAALLVRFWIAKGRAEPANCLSSWYFQYRSAFGCRVWSAAVKARILAQKPRIAKWSIDQCSYECVPLREAHWHIDPPYNNAAGRRYPHSNVDYDDLAVWCRALPGTVDVFENDGADWLPFLPLCEVVTTRGRKSGAISKEMICRLPENRSAK